MVKIRYIGKCLLIETGEKEEKGRKRTLVIGDLHLGYEEALNRTGVFVSRGMFEDLMSYLEKIFAEIGKVDEVVLLGDVKHDFGSILKQERNDSIKLINWLLERAKRVTIVKGNHDSILEPVLRGKDRVELLEYYFNDDVCFIHGDKDYDKIWEGKIKAVVMGHVHPAIRLNDGVKSEKYKCFLAGKIKKGLKKKELIIVPSFSEHGGDLDVLNKDIELPWSLDLNKLEIKIVQEENLEVLNFGKLSKLR
jgi:putative SbcD/Mre11-related phosphoesterase